MYGISRQNIKFSLSLIAISRRNDNDFTNNDLCKKMLLNEARKICLNSKKSNYISFINKNAILSFFIQVYAIEMYQLVS